MPEANRDAAIAVQREYYAKTAGTYDGAHIDSDSEHLYAMAIFSSMLSHFGARSLLDVGAGTGRVACSLRTTNPSLKVTSVEPVEELRRLGHSKGLSESELIDGDATRLPFPDNHFDFSCEFAVLHHIANPEMAVKEMLRVSRRGIFISDSNNFGQGGPAARLLKQALNALGLWKAYDFVKTRGKGYMITEGDGLSHSYSVFNNYGQVARECDVYLFNTRPSGRSLYRSATHVALMGIKRA